MWNDYTGVLESHVTAHVLAQQKDAFYSAVGKLIYELSHYKDDPKMVRLALEKWRLEEIVYLDEVLSKPDICVPGDPNHN
jgi:hypothetical protein